MRSAIGFDAHQFQVLTQHFLRFAGVVLLDLDERQLIAGSESVRTGTADAILVGLRSFPAEVKRLMDLAQAEPGLAQACRRRMLRQVRVQDIGLAGEFLPLAIVLAGQPQHVQLAPRIGGGLRGLLVGGGGFPEMMPGRFVALLRCPGHLLLPGLVALGSGPRLHHLRQKNQGVVRRRQ
ncbi:MAG: hypothetical protein E6K70_18500, partial [Planctomycetota bacterium]